MPGIGIARRAGDAGARTGREPDGAKELEDPKGYGAIEYAYHLMAQAAGITMSECRLLEEQFRRMVFNIVARNQDDHVKNIAFLMDKQGEWQARACL